MAPTSAACARRRPTHCLNAERRADGTVVTYDPLKQITQVTDDRNHVTRIAYDNLGRRTSIDNPDTGRTETRYDTASNVTAKITSNLRATGQSVTYAYDFNRLTGISYPNNPGNNVAYTYGAPGAANNSAGRIVRLTDAGGTEDRTYGPLGEVTKTIRTMTAQATGGSPPPVYTTLYQYDTWNRLLKLSYPDGEVLTYGYDSGGNLTQAQGVKGSYTYGYLNRLTYDKFEQRSSLESGNGITAQYRYDPRNRRLANLATGQGQGGGNRFQNLHYGYDNVGNITSLQNDVPVPPNNQYGGPTQQAFQYDDLYRLTGAQGNYTTAHGLRQYTFNMAYDTIHNITSKQQTDVLNGRTQAGTSYHWLYAYSQPPHAPTHIGQRTYTYDANGNQSGFTDDSNGNRRTLVWDEDNRLLSVEDQGNITRFVYDHQGTRLIKANGQGTSVYVNQFYTTGTGRSTKHVFAGTTRIASKIEKNNEDTGPSPNASPSAVGPIEKDLYFYHPDHLGSSNYVTDRQGRVYEHAEYFPFGETWVLEATNTQAIPYLYTGKELDTETGLYYFGARYYDPRTSVWQSADPVLEKYLPNTPKKPEEVVKLLPLTAQRPLMHFDLPGMGGVFEAKNLNLYAYAHQNPIRYTDPDGNASTDQMLTQIKENIVSVRRDVEGLNVNFKSDRAKLAVYATAAGDFKSFSDAARLIRNKTDAGLYKTKLTLDLAKAGAKIHLPEIAKQVADSGMDLGSEDTPLAFIKAIGGSVGLRAEALGAVLTGGDLKQVGDLAEKIIGGTSPESLGNLMRHGIDFYSRTCGGTTNCGD